MSHQKSLAPAPKHPKCQGSASNSGPCMHSTQQRIAWDQCWSLSHKIRTRFNSRTGPEQVLAWTLLWGRLPLPFKIHPMKALCGITCQIRKNSSQLKSIQSAKGLFPIQRPGYILAKTGLRGTSVGGCLIRSGPDSNQGQGLNKLAAELLFVTIAYGPRTCRWSLDSTSCKHHPQSCHIRKVSPQLQSIQSAKRLLPTQDPTFNTTTNRIAWDQRWSLSQTVMMRLKPRTGSKQGCRRTLICHDQLQFKIAPLQFGFNHVQASWQHSTCHIRKVSSQHHDSIQSPKGISHVSTAQNLSRICSNGFFFRKFPSQHFRGLRFGIQALNSVQKHICKLSWTELISRAFANFPELSHTFANETFAQSFADLSRLHVLLSRRHSTLLSGTNRNMKNCYLGSFGRCSCDEHPPFPP